MLFPLRHLDRPSLPQMEVLEEGTLAWIQSLEEDLFPSLHPAVVMGQVPYVEPIHI